MSREEVIEGIAKDILAKVPQQFELETISKSFGPSISPTTVVLLQEVERFNRLCRRISSSLSLLCKVSYTLTHYIPCVTILSLPASPPFSPTAGSGR